MKYNLKRFLDAQERDYERALSEIRMGRKRSHWIWYIFPQLKELGYSSRAQFYGIDGLEEAREYMAHPVLRERLCEISNALLLLKETDPALVMGYPDDLKLCSCMTLFREVAPEEAVFQKVLDQYYQGKADQETVRLLAEVR